MEQFRSKPTVIEAIQYLGPEFVHEKDPTQGSPLYPQITWASGEKQGVAGRWAEVVGKQGAVRIKTNDWIIREPDGAGFYPCAPDVFERRWEAMEVSPRPVDLPKPAICETFRIDPPNQ